MSKQPVAPFRGIQDGVESFHFYDFTLAHHLKHMQSLALCEAMKGSKAVRNSTHTSITEAGMHLWTSAVTDDS